MSKLSDAEIAIAVAEAGGFSAAAEDLGLSQPAVSRRVRGLEDRLGLRLFERTTRHVRPTEAGLRYVDRARSGLREIAEAESEASQGIGTARGIVRVSAASAYARARVVPRIASFLECNPEVRLELDLADRYVDLVADGIDVAIRVGPARSSDLIARRLEKGRMRLCAAPAFLARNRMPKRPTDIATASTLVMSTYTDRTVWHFRHPKKRVREKISLRPSAVFNDAESIRIGTLGGAGIAALPDYLVEEDIVSGDLIELLPRFHLGTYVVAAVFTERRHLRSAVRAFLDFLTEA